MLYTGYIIHPLSYTLGYTNSQKIWIQVKRLRGRLFNRGDRTCKRTEAKRTTCRIRCQKYVGNGFRAWNFWCNFFTRCSCLCKEGGKIELFEKIERKIVGCWFHKLNSHVQKRLFGRRKQNLFWWLRPHRSQIEKYFSFKLNILVYIFISNN